VGTYRLPGPGRDGVMVVRDGTLARVLWIGDEEVLVRAWAAGRAVRIRAEAQSRDAAEAAIERMRFALGTDHDLSEFHRRFRWDPLIGPVIRRRPWVRPRRRPEPFEALAWAVCEQLIESGRAAAIQRKIVRRHGRRSACGTLLAPPSAAFLAGRSPAELDACGLAPKIEFVDMPDAIRPNYQYFTQASMTKLRRAGYNAPFTPLEDAVRDCVTQHLSQSDPYL